MLNVLLCLSFLLLLFPKNVLASDFSPTNFYDWNNWPRAGLVLAESTTSAQPEIRNARGLLPGSVFYFLKPLAENVSLAFTFDPKAKQTKKLDLTEERLAETKVLLEKNQYKLASDNLGRYEISLNEVTTSISILKNSKINVVDLAEKLELYSAKHSLVLENLEQNTPEEVKYRLTTALQAAEKGMDKSADELNKSPVTLELRERLEVLRGLGILTTEEIDFISNLSSRGEVRRKLEDLVDQNIFPAGDVKKVDDSQLYFFPNEYAKISEQRKIAEFVKLDGQKPDEETQKRISELAAKYKPGDAVPPDIRKWWASTQRYKELQATLRPELVPIPSVPREKIETPKAQDQKNTSDVINQSTQTTSPTSQGQEQKTSAENSSSPTSPALSTPEYGSQCNFGPHAIGTIFGDSRCYYLRCEAGWYNNDLDVNNGCESNTDAKVTPTPGSSAAGICGSGQVKNDAGVCVPENQTCTDTNSAVPFYTTGTCTDQAGTHANYCDGSVAKDYFCEGTWDSKTFSSSNHRCVVSSFDCGIASTVEQYTCSVGACKKP
ncbi:MAG: hypothetical protein A3A61_02585 [Candidatus Woykebacteria bacterium RIFCSPLOWO2_01_FULL_43_14]|uniref:DUF5667 domain-containing protein n=2 Tax=Candidatus Woykeibacteriota TaxID=1817899 RepID=A0A1G1WW02_9BACT|nr:MAG: hypothetical protein A3J50_03770 [Candidatus Woykebacteria bacterium RIFCSPHIGHO2_02_FULL_43_16b]OGY31337.1 MAG: hypothetical protein A3A61_02585 [Candidatus Woykebacteria bacterium RIFCSPLOWO2_01_FULL_43_14]